MVMCVMIISVVLVKKIMGDHEFTMVLHLYTCSCDKVTLSEEFTGKISSSSRLPP